MTLGAGSSSLAFTLLSRSGAETGGGTMLALLTTGTRMLANSRWALVGAGGTMLESSWGVLRILSRETCGAGGIRGAVVRIFASSVLAHRPAPKLLRSMVNPKRAH